MSNLKPIGETLDSVQARFDLLRRARKLRELRATAIANIAVLDRELAELDELLDVIAGPVRTPFDAIVPGMPPARRLLP